MSFPGRPPVTIPGMPLPPGMLPPPPYGMPGLHGMMPMPPGLAMVPPPMMPPVNVVTTNSASFSKGPTISSAPVLIKQPVSSQNVTTITGAPVTTNLTTEMMEKPKPVGPVITVFVGNISERASDILIRQMLQRCGLVNNWKRVQGASGKLQAFGFCDYTDAESALRAIRILHDWELGEKKLVVKCDAKTNSMLDDYKAEHANDEEHKKSEEENDEGAITAIKSLIKECFIDSGKTTDSDSKPAPLPQKELDIGGIGRQNNPNLNDIEADVEKKSLIHREIGKFREFCQKDAETKDKQKDISRERRERDKERERRDREREFSPRDIDRLKHDNYQRSRSRSVDKERDNYSYRDRGDRERMRDNDRDRNYSRNGKDSEEEEEEKDRRRNERKLREKEASYQERLKAWETRERKKVREYEKDREKDDDKKKEEAKEAKRLKEFLEDYEDGRDDPKYYRGSALSRRMKERDREIESDNRDRQKEKEDIDELRRRLTDEGHPDPLAEVRRRQTEEDDRIREKLKTEVVKKGLKRKPHTPSPPPAVEEVDSNSPNMLAAVPSVGQESMSEDVISQNTNSLSGLSDIVTPPTKDDSKNKPLVFSGLKLAGSSSPTQNTTSSSSSSDVSAAKKKKMSVGEMFNSQDEDTDDNGSRKRKLVPLEYTAEEMKAVNQQSSSSPNSPNSNYNIEVKRKDIKNLIEKIPTAKDELFSYNVDRSLVDNSLMEKRIKPWVIKKIIEYIGEEEPTLVEFICSKVMAGSSPRSILEDVTMVLDDEAEVFVVKMWRLLIYEIEAKKLGIGK